MSYVQNVTYRVRGTIIKESFVRNFDTQYAVYEVQRRHDKQFYVETPNVRAGKKCAIPSKPGFFGIGVESLDQLLKWLFVRDNPRITH